ncbi:MAG: hypothetical protein AAF333_01655 [Planctomycetota bacterium]
MRRFNLPLLVVLSCLCWMGCDSVTVMHPVGEPVVYGEIELMESSIDAGRYLEGVWAGPKESDLVVSVTWVGKGNLRGSFIKWNDGELDLSDEFYIKLTRHEDAWYLNLYAPEEVEEKGYSFVRLLPTDEDAVVLLMPRAGTFAQAVEEQRVAGEIENPGNPLTVKLTGTKDEIDALVRQDEVGTQFGFERPLLFRRVASPSQ